MFERTGGRKAQCSWIGRRLFRRLAATALSERTTMAEMESSAFIHAAICLQARRPETRATFNLFKCPDETRADGGPRVSQTKLPNPPWFALPGRQSEFSSAHVRPCSNLPERHRNSEASVRMKHLASHGAQAHPRISICNRTMMLALICASLSSEAARGRARSGRPRGRVVPPKP
jgi:hypothetical protein